MATPNRSHLVQVAKRIKCQLAGNPFLTMDRIDVTDMVREVSGEEGTRLKATMAGELEQALLEQGVRCFPLLQQTTTGDLIRFFHTATTMGALVDLLLYPDSNEDHEVLAVLTKVRPVWKSTPIGPS